MSIQPIDLQTLFAHLHSVGKEQAILKDAAVLQQEAQGSELVKETQHRDKSVNEAGEMEDGPGKVEDRKNRNPHSGEEKSKKKKQEEENDGEGRQIYEDPDIGNNIDISG